MLKATDTVIATYSGFLYARNDVINNKSDRLVAEYAYYCAVKSRATHAKSALHTIICQLQQIRDGQISAKQ